MTSGDLSFIERFVCGIEEEIDKGDKVFFGRRILRYETEVFRVGEYFDVIKTISPVLIKQKTKKYLSKDEGWKDILLEKCLKKLEKEGIVDDTFGIEFGNPDNIKDKSVLVHNSYSPCISFVCMVKGKPLTRKCLYELGLGGSTGNGFGSVMILSGLKK